MGLLDDAIQDRGSETGRQSAWDEWYRRFDWPNRGYVRPLHPVSILGVGIEEIARDFARRLTLGPGDEAFAVMCPDGFKALVRPREVGTGRWSHGAPLMANLREEGEYLRAYDLEWSNGGDSSEHWQLCLDDSGEAYVAEHLAIGSSRLQPQGSYLSHGTDRQFAEAAAACLARQQSEIQARPKKKGWFSW